MGDRKGQGEAGAADDWTPLASPCTNCGVYADTTHVTHEVYQLDIWQSPRGTYDIKIEVEVDIYRCKVCGFIFSKISVERI